MMDYAKLLKDYMRFVRDYEGTDFVCNLDAICSGNMSEEQRAELARISKELCDEP